MTRELPNSGEQPTKPADDGDVKVLVTSQAFADFNAWIDVELDKLVARWVHRAAPNADVPRRTMRPR